MAVNKEELKWQPRVANMDKVRSCDLCGATPGELFPITDNYTGEKLLVCLDCLADY